MQLVAINSILLLLAHVLMPHESDITVMTVTAALLKDLLLSSMRWHLGLNKEPFFQLA